MTLRDSVRRLIDDTMTLRDFVSGFLLDHIGQWQHYLYRRGRPVPCLPLRLILVPFFPYH